jgi:hypothetical protein
MPTEKSILSIVFNPESVGGLLIRLWVASVLVGGLTAISLLMSALSGGNN